MTLDTMQTNEIQPVPEIGSSSSLAAGNKDDLVIPQKGDPPDVIPENVAEEQAPGKITQCTVDIEWLSASISRNVVRQSLKPEQEESSTNTKLWICYESKTASEKGHTMNLREEEASNRLHQVWYW